MLNSESGKISQPIERFDFDFIILFSDILVVPHALGQFVDFKENIGPVLEPINDKYDLDFRKLTKNMKSLDPVFKTIKIIKKKNIERIDWFLWRSFYSFNVYDRRGTSRNHQR